MTKKNYIVITCLLIIAGSELHAGLGAGHVAVEPGKAHTDPTARVGEQGGGHAPGGHEGMTKAQIDLAAKQARDGNNPPPAPSSPAPSAHPVEFQQPHTESSPRNEGIWSGLNDGPRQANEAGFQLREDNTTLNTSTPTDNLNQSQSGFRGSSRVTISNQLHNAFSISGNKRSTATDAHTGDKIVTTKGPDIKNSDGTITPGKIISKITTRTDGTTRTEVYKTDGTISEVQEVGKKSIDGQQITEVTDGTGKKVRTIKTTDSTSRLLNNKTVEITTYDAAGEHPSVIKVTDSNGKLITTQTFESDGKSYTTVNSKNQLIQKSTIDPKTGIKTTIKYKDPTGKDKSSETIIEDPTKPNEITTEVRNKDGNLTSTKKTDLTTNESTNSNHLADFSEQQFKLFNNAIAKMSKNLIRNNTLGKWMDTTYPAVKRINDRIKALPEATRNLTIDTVTTLQKIEAAKKGESQIYNDTDKQEIAKNILQSHISNVFGKDTMSGEHAFSLDTTTEPGISILKKIAENPDLFDPSKTVAQRTQAVADSADFIMNTLSNFDAQNSAGTPPPFRTSIDENGNYSSIITSDSGISSKTTADKTGKITERQMTVINPDGKSPNSAAVYVTSFDSNGKPTTILKRGDINQTQDPADVQLSDEDATIIEAAHEQLTTRQTLIAMTKATLWTAKQVAPNFVKVNPVTQALVVASALPILGIVKAGSMAVGYKYSDPIVKSFISHCVELTMGNRRGFSSADPNRVFTKGTAPSKALQLLQGKMTTKIGEAGVGKAIYDAVTTFSIDPLAKAYSHAFPEERTPTEEYYRSLDDIIVESSVEAFKMIFKETEMPTDKKDNSELNKESTDSNDTKNPEQTPEATTDNNPQPKNTTSASEMFTTRQYKNNAARALTTGKASIYDVGDLVSAWISIGRS